MPPEGTNTRHTFFFVYQLLLMYSFVLSLFIPFLFILTLSSLSFWIGPFLFLNMVRTIVQIGVWVKNQTRMESIVDSDDPAHD